MKIEETFKFLLFVDSYREKYDINIQLWDEINIYVHAKDTAGTELTSIGGYDNLEEAFGELLNILRALDKERS